MDTEDPVPTGVSVSRPACSITRVELIFLLGPLATGVLASSLPGLLGILMGAVDPLVQALCGEQSKRGGCDARSPGARCPNSKAQGFSLSATEPSESPPRLHPGNFLRDLQSHLTLSDHSLCSSQKPGKGEPLKT